MKNVVHKYCFLDVMLLNFTSCFLRGILTMLLHIMVAQIIKKGIVENITLFDFILLDIKEYFCKNNNYHNVVNNPSISQKWLKWFTNFMKIVMSIEPYCWTVFVNHVKVDNFNFTNVCSQLVDHKCVIIWNFDQKITFTWRGNKNCDMDSCIKSISKCFFGWLTKQNIIEIWN